jgi:hypothetical protein
MVGSNAEQHNANWGKLSCADACLLLCSSCNAKPPQVCSWKSLHAAAAPIERQSLLQAAQRPALDHATCTYSRVSTIFCCITGQAVARVCWHLHNTTKDSVSNGITAATLLCLIRLAAKQVEHLHWAAFPQQFLQLLQAQTCASLPGWHCCSSCTDVHPTTVRTFDKRAHLPL